jgi:hypothetical protein
VNEGLTDWLNVSGSSTGKVTGVGFHHIRGCAVVIYEGLSLNPIASTTSVSPFFVTTTSM